MMRAPRRLSLAVLSLAMALGGASCAKKGGPVSVTRVDPETGTTGGGDQVTIKGAGFEPGTTTADVRFGRKRAEGVVIASTTDINVTTPSSERGPVDVTVILNDGTAFTIPNGFRYVEPQDSAKVREAYLKTEGK
ncbi:MAG: IPT/TIG domain-containing protein [Myxococcales bacterium]|nr:IPT/TIG domain-containing protein [Myxococcales bacterium]